MKIIKGATGVLCLMGLIAGAGLCLHSAFALAPWHDSKTITDLANQPSRVVVGSYDNASGDVLRRIATRVGYDRLERQRGIAGDATKTLQVGDTIVALELSSGPNATSRYAHHPLLYEIHVDDNNVLHYAAAYSEARPTEMKVFMTKELYEKLPKSILTQWLQEIIHTTHGFLLNVTRRHCPMP